MNCVFDCLAACPLWALSSMYLKHHQIEFAVIFKRAKNNILVNCQRLGSGPMFEEPKDTKLGQNLTIEKQQGT